MLIYFQQFFINIRITAANWNFFTGNLNFISAEFFNKNYEFDEKAQLTIQVVNSKTKAFKKYDLLKSISNFKVNLDGLLPGNYSFKIIEKNSNSSFAGSFEILNFDLERCPFNLVFKEHFVLPIYLIL